MICYVPPFDGPESFLGSGKIDTLDRSEHELINENMTLLTLIFGALTGSLLSVLVGLVGRKRRIGFGWAFVLSLVFTPLVGLLVTLVSDPLPQGNERWGCLAPLLALVAFVFLAGILFLLLTGAVLL